MQRDGGKSGIKLQERGERKKKYPTDKDFSKNRREDCIIAA
jgi:hypothetical protein